MGDQGWDETREGAAAAEWVEIYVDEVIQALDDGRLASARHLTGPGFIAEGLQGLGIAEFVLRRTIALADQAHGCLTSRPVDEAGAWDLVRVIGRLWGVHA